MASAQSSETVTINLDNFIMPGALLLSALVLSGSLFFGLNNIANAVKNIPAVAGATTTTTTDTAGATGTVTVTKDQITALYNATTGIKFGDANRKVTFVEFSDPSCPFCHIAGGNNPSLNKEAGERFVLVQDGGTYVAPVKEFKKLVDSGQASYIWFYTNGHGNGELASKALYCAHEQGKFWEAHDYLYSTAGYTLVNDVVKNDKAKSGDLANALAPYLNAGQLKSCLDSGKYDSYLSQDAATGASLGVSGTPGFFVNETNFAGAYSFTDMKPTVDAALAN